MWTTYDTQVALVRSVKATLIAREALLQVTCKPSLPCTRLCAVWTGNGQVTALLVLIKLGLTREHESAAVTSEVVTFVMRFQSGDVRPIKIASNL
jgi:hypothetical protein